LSRLFSKLANQSQNADNGSSRIFENNKFPWLRGLFSAGHLVASTTGVKLKDKTDHIYAQLGNRDKKQDQIAMSLVFLEACFAKNSADLLLLPSVK
jgi:hypothetical protein